MTDKYAIVTTINTRRYYWRKRQANAKGSAGQWTDFIDASKFSVEQRQDTRLPPHGQWVSVLHGMGTGTMYPALSELTNAPTGVVNPHPERSDGNEGR